MEKNGKKSEKNGKILRKYLKKNYDKIFKSEKFPTEIFPLPTLLNIPVLGLFTAIAVLFLVES